MCIIVDAFFDAWLENNKDLIYFSRIKLQIDHSYNWFKKQIGFYGEGKVLGERRREWEGMVFEG